ncbi:MAG: L-2-hydroxyglutarate oxidase [Chloroflexi bacterium]|nr:L-2-hydroxyglutarate oxidase [Chloroflexota bacterium]MDA1281980.1 L-2-hydroxyglutarate oxidase [Chloroflexota bacterium]
MSSTKYDVVVIGAGIIGLSTAMKLLERFPQLKLAIVEKNVKEGTQQSGHNSGVIHSGIYYRPGSFKADFCVAGRSSMTQFCEENDIPVWTCGKLIVASDAAGVERLNALEERGTANQVDGLRMVDNDEMTEIEPHVVALKALYAPGTGIVDYRNVTAVYADRVREAGGEIHFSTELNGSKVVGGVTVLTTSSGDFETSNVINCAGLHSDLVAETMGVETGLRIIPFRGEYYKLRKESEFMVKGLIYPVPDPAFPFLGVHLTQTMKGWVEAGPNAVLATKREGYRKRDFSMNDFLRTITYPGFWKMGIREWKTGVWEINRSLRKSVFLDSLQQLVPELSSNDLDGTGSGVRAQAVDRAGNLVDDFRIEESRGAIHVLNAPSPGATSSLVIGDYIADLAVKNFGLTATPSVAIS